MLKKSNQIIKKKFRILIKIKKLPIVKSGVFAGEMRKLYNMGKTATSMVITLIVISLVNTVEHHWRVLARASSSKVK